MTDVASNEADLGRKMVRASLSGRHSHPSAKNSNVHIWRRGKTFLARGRIDGQAFGKTLGSDEKSAEIKLRQILVEIDDGRFVRPSAKKKQAIKSLVPERLTFLELCNSYISETRKLKGEKTTADYCSRLMHAIRFADESNSRKLWPYAGDIDRDFAIELRGYLHRAVTTRNGKPGGVPKPLSERHIHNVLEQMRTTIHWASRADIHLLPFGFANPFTKEIVGDRGCKDPLRDQILPLEARIALIHKLDCWQLATIGLLAVLPLRPEDVQGILIGDVNFEACTLRIGTRFQGADFTKGKTNVLMPLPLALIPILYACAGDRYEGPLLRRRAIWNLSRTSKVDVVDREDFLALLQERLTDSESVASCANDRKQIVRTLLSDLGAVNPNQLNREFKAQVGECAGHKPYLYQLRHAVTTDMKRSGISHLELRYLTEHKTDDIMNEYTGIDPAGEMQKYFSYAAPLLKAIEKRGEELGFAAPMTNPGWRNEAVETVFVSC